MNPLKVERINKGLTQLEAAKKIGISYSTLTKLESNHKDASKKTMVKFANFYNKSVDYLFFTTYNH
ncbi:helix-turn-helix transcriptional regulator [Dellaglioa algida]|uniref:helix-turn-helix transcriptional regulator n=1 Tax=Dellaglioa algida TaxID=105612 RepID=UPI0024C475EA|nr:helix-turn-helix transcriptional regulator [Dellaglioa algida]MDK1716598.1 helix-turn-helix transcriptional regulator [Dellaglioa algida]MDK1721540.1 helix-turn-helix transcriptional regulator [Dellaglioa algida]